MGAEMLPFLGFASFAWTIRFCFFSTPLLSSRTGFGLDSLDITPRVYGVWMGKGGHTADGADREHS